jgi:hypothetical protein
MCKFEPDDCGAGAMGSDGTGADVVEADVNDLDVTGADGAESGENVDITGPGAV